MQRRKTCFWVLAVSILVMSGCTNTSPNQAVKNEKDADKIVIDTNVNADTSTNIKINADEENDINATADKAASENKDASENKAAAENKDVTERDESDVAKLALSQEVLQYKDITYGQYKEKTGKEAEFYHACRYLAQLPDMNVAVIFEGEWDEELAMASLQDNDKCLRFEGKLDSIMIGLTERMDVDSFIKKLAVDGDKVPEYSFEEGAGTAYYVANRYVAIRLEDDNEVAVLEISLDESEEIEPDSFAWLYWEDAE